MCERKIRRKNRLRSRLLLFRRNRQRRLLQPEIFLDNPPERISKKLINDAVSGFTNGNDILQLDIREMEVFILKLHSEYQPKSMTNENI